MGTRKGFYATLEQKQEVIDLYHSGMSLAAIGTEHGSSVQAVLTVLKNSGIPRRPRGKFGKGSNHPMWNGGKAPTADGYIRIWLPPGDPLRVMCRKSDGHYVLEHRLVMARKLGRPLTSKETVHHIDGDKTNNSPDNLQLRSSRHGPGQVRRCIDCGSFNIGALPLSGSLTRPDANAPSRQEPGSGSKSER